MPFYRGNPAGGRFVVTVLDDRGQVHSRDPRLDLRNHSPDGFAWGYAGPGPAQLALAILCDALGDDERATRLYQRFKCSDRGARPRWALDLGTPKRARRRFTP